MAHFLRGKQAGIQNDLSAGVDPELFMPDDVARYGVNSQVSALAYDPVQSLLAVGTSDSQFGPGQIYVFGQKRVSVVFRLPRRASIQQLKFVASRLVCLDSKNDVSIFDLENKKMIANYAAPGQVTLIVTDPSIDYCLTGLSNGSVVAYDLDREAMTPFKIPNLWPQQNARTRILPVVALQFHPKDIGTLLIGYPEGAVIYSFKQNKALKVFHYEVPRGAPGGDGNPAAIGQSRSPRLTHAVWHPTGTFVLTAHDDGSLVFWDPRDGRPVHARTISEVDVNTPKAIPMSPGGTSMSPKEPYIKIAWCAKENADDTGLLISGGNPLRNQTPGLTWIEFGVTPNYQTSSWDVLANHFRNPRRIHQVPLPPNTQVINFLLIPRTSPHYNGAHDPIAILAILSSGEMITLSFPTGHSISPTNQLPVSLSFIHPFVTKTALASVERTRWLGTREYRQQGPPFLRGGAEATRPTKRFEDRNVLLTAHADGTVRVWDAGNGDEIENSIVLQVDLARAVGRWDNIAVSQMSMSGVTGEISVGLLSGEVVVFRLNRNQNVGRPPMSASPNEGPGKLTDVTSRTDNALKEGFLPLTLINDQQGRVTAIKQSNVGFLAAGYESGGVTVVDLRGPAIIHTVLIQELAGKQRRGTIRGRNQSTPQQQEYPTVMEFGVMTLEGDNYSSIALFVGTNRGRVLTFKILPSQSGRYSVQLAGMSQVSDDRVISISPIQSDTGHPATASGQAVAGLQSGQRVNGVIVVVSISSIHIFRPSSAKGASKAFDESFCDAAAIARFETRGFAVLGLFGDGCVRAFSIPGLKEVGSSRVNHIMDVKRFPDALISPTGDVIGWSGPSEMAIMSVWGAKQSLPDSPDLLYDPVKLPLPRPTISNLQWIAGTQYITPADLDVLIGGADRPPSKRMVAEMRAQQEQEHLKMREAARAGRPAPPPDPNQEGYFAYMQRQIQERTEALGLTGDSMDRTAESTSSWSDDVHSYIAKQKRQAALGFIGSKLGF